jgi:low temperature requirement protein LtrA
VDPGARAGARRAGGGYWLPRRGRAATTDWDIDGAHFAERCQPFIIIALGESVVVTGATASEARMTSTVVLCLVVGFVQTAAVWWLYFGATAEQARITLSTCEDPGRLARDAYTYFHLPIVAGIIATAVTNNSAHRRAPPDAERSRRGDDPRRARSTCLATACSIGG